MYGDIYFCPVHARYATCNTAFVSPRGLYSSMSPSKPCYIWIMSTCHIFMSHVNVIMLHVDITYLACTCKGQKHATIVMIIIKYYLHYANFTIFNFLTGRGAGNDELNWSFPAMLMVPGNCRGSGVTAKLTTVAGSLFPQFCHWKASTRDAFDLPCIISVNN